MAPTRKAENKKSTSVLLVARNKRVVHAEKSEDWPRRAVASLLWTTVFALFGAIPTQMDKRAISVQLPRRRHTKNKPCPTYTNNTNISPARPPHQVNCRKAFKSSISCIARTILCVLLKKNPTPERVRANAGSWLPGVCFHVLAVGKAYVFIELL